MSTSDSDGAFAAALVGQALIRSAAAFGQHRRLYLGEYFGLPPSEVFTALEERLEPCQPPLLVTAADRSVHELRAVDLRATAGAGGYLVPYLVGPATGRSNAGSAGFAAFLRDALATEHDGRPTTLLVLHADPVETVKTAAQDAAELPALAWHSILRAAVEGADTGVADLLTSAIDAADNRLQQSAETVGRVRALAGSADEAAAGRALHLLAPFLSDPHAATAPRSRLKAAMKWRSDLEDWSSPDQDLEARLLPRYEAPSDPRLQTVLAARDPFGLDFSKFTYDDLPGFGNVRPARLAQPLRVRGGGAATAGSRAAAWLPGGGTLSLVLAGAATRSEQVTLQWSDGSTSSAQLAPGALEVTVDVTRPGWSYLNVRMPGGQAAQLAINTDPGQWAPVEVTLDIDTVVGAFRCHDEPQVVALAASGAILGQARLDALPPPDGERHLVEASHAGDRGSLHLLLTEDATSDSDSDRDSRDGDADTDGDHRADQDTAGAPEAGSAAEDVPPPPKLGPVATGAHALIGASRDGSPGQITDFFIPEDGRAYFSPGTFRLDEQDIDGVDGLLLEADILARPELLAFTLVRQPGTFALEPHAYLSSLDLGALPTDEFAAFTTARAALFGRLSADRHRASVHSIGAGCALSEAGAYVNAYRDLLAAAAGTARFRAEYEAVLLVDSVFDTATGSWWIAPTSPLAVAYLLQFREQALDWAGQADQLLDDDVLTCTMRHLLPTFHVEGTWYQSAASTCFLWRRYGQASEADPAESRPTYVAKRIRRFLDVHPAYHDGRQELAIAFVEPGDGSGPLQALRALAAPLTRQRDGASLPRLSVTVASSSDRPTALEEVLRGGGKVSEVDRALRDRVRLRRRVSDDELDFHHLAFVFQSSLRDDPAVVEMDARAATTFVGGLATAPGRAMEVDRNETAFSWGTFVGPPTGSPLVDIARHGLELIGGMPREPLASGRTRMPTARVRQGSLEPLYASSAWVVHLDRLLGLEAFAQDVSGTQTRYLIDFEERSDPGQPGLDAITATSRINPYRLALRQALAGLGTPSQQALDRILQTFNCVSGKWALDLVGASGHGLQERVGLAAALNAMRDLDGWRSEKDAVGVVIPLDEFIDSLPPGARPRDGQRCDDLLYLCVPLHPAPGRPQPVLCRLVEVKYRQSSDIASAECARRQLERSREWLDRAFNGRGPGRPFRSRDLAELLRGAVTRARSFGFLALDAPAETDLEASLGRIARQDYAMQLCYTVAGRRYFGDFISVEPSSAVAVHRQDLPGTGLPLGHIRLGRPALEALAAGRAVARPPNWETPSLTADPPEPPSGSAPRAPAAPAVPTDVGATSRSGTDTPGEPDGDERPPAGRSGDRPAELGLIASRLDGAFAKYGLGVEPFSVDIAQVGPSVIRFRTRTLGKLSISEVERRARDIGREIAAPGEVHVSDEPGFVTIDVPRAQRDTVPLDAVLPALDAAPARPGALNFVVGVAPSGEVRVADLSRLPHLLVAGATGSGKSVFLRGLLTQLLRTRTPEQLQLLIVDPKRLDFVAFTKALHLRGGTIISDPDQAVETLQFTLDAEIALRQPLLEAAGVSSAAEFYEAGGRLEELPQLVILVDEFADLVLSGSDSKAFLDLIQRYAQLTRAYGIFLVLATQRPSVNVITGSIKANLAARVVFSLPSARDSMTVIDHGGAEDLLGDGDMIFYRSGRIERLQAPFSSLQDVRGVLP